MALRKHSKERGKDRMPSLCTPSGIASTRWLWYAWPLGAEVDGWD